MIFAKAALQLRYASGPRAKASMSAQGRSQYLHFLPSQAVPHLGVIDESLVIGQAMERRLVMMLMKRL
jgi:hypothetical protein